MTWKIKYEDLSIKGQEQQEAKPVGMLAIFNRATGAGPTGHAMVGRTTLNSITLTDCRPLKKSVQYKGLANSQQIF